jgi:ABC-type sulfate transport system permease component
MLLAKMSIALFLLRVAVNRVHRRIIHASIAMSVASLLSFFFVCLFQCWPISYYWDKHTQTGKCVNNTVVVVMAYMFSVVSIITDLIFALVPAWIVSRLNMKLKSKVALIFLMALGCM